MAIISKSGFGGKMNSSPNVGGSLVACKVKDVILDPNTSKAKGLGGHEAIGVIFYNRMTKKRATGGINPDAAEKRSHPGYDGYAYPLFPHIKYYPLIGEVVTIITLTSKNHIDDRTALEDYYFPPINIWNHQHHNSLPSPQNFFDRKEKGAITNIVDDYTIEGLVRRPASGSINLNIPLGDYFEEKLGLKPLLPYEGDYITEGRFGNSIRFGATARDIADADRGKDYQFDKGEEGNFDMRNPWSRGTKTNNGDPITIIRNGQSLDVDDTISQEGYAGSEGWKHTIENINLDPASIYLTSTQNIANFQVAAPMCWYSFGLNTQPKEDKNDEAQKLIDDPENFIITDKVVQAL